LPGTETNRNVGGIDLTDLYIYKVELVLTNFSKFKLKICITDTIEKPHER